MLGAVILIDVAGCGSCLSPIGGRELLLQVGEALLQGGAQAHLLHKEVMVVVASLQVAHAEVPVYLVYLPLHVVDLVLYDGGRAVASAACGAHVWVYRA